MGDIAPDDADLRSVLESLSHTDKLGEQLKRRTVLLRKSPRWLLGPRGRPRSSQSIHFDFNCGGLSVDARKKISVVETGEPSAAEEIGKRVLRNFIEYGAGELIQVARAR